MPTPSFTLKSLTLRSFRSVVDEQVIPLPTTGMHLLVGPSGAGKTTIGEAIAFALGYSNFSAIDLQSWHWLSKETLRDTLEVETAKGTLKVTRGKSASILMPGEDKARTSAKAIKEGLIQALGIDPEKYLAPLTYRSQKSPGLFLSMTDSQKKSFLTQLLGLDAFEAAVEKAVANVSTLSSAVERAKAKHETLLTTVPVAPTLPQLQDEAAAAAKVVAAEVECERIRKVVEETKALDVALSEQQAAKVSAVKEQWKPRLHKAEREMSSVPPVDVSPEQAALTANRACQSDYTREHQTQVRIIDQQLTVLQNSIAGLQNIVSKKTAAESRLMHAEADHDQISADVCYVCRRDWPDDPNKVAALAACEKDIAEQKQIIKTSDEAAEQLPALKQQVLELQKRKQHLQSINPISLELVEEEHHLLGAIASAKSMRDAKVAALKAEYHSLVAEEQREMQAVSAMTPEEEQVRRTLGDLQNLLSGLGHQVAQAKQGLAWAKSGNESARTYHNQVLATRAAALEGVAKAATEVKDVETGLAQEQDFLGMVRGFLGYIFDETLARIADATNARLALIPNVADLTLRFASERETGTGKLRQEIVPVCERSGHLIPLKAGVSGGQYTSVELAVDLSLADVIAERTGVYAGWLILDEPFDGLDTECRAACFELLKGASKDRAIIVVDHATELKEMFDSRIEISSENGRTHVQSY